MRNFIYLLVLLNIFSCGEDDNAVPQLPPPVPTCEETDCPHVEEFYGKSLMNGECWLAEWTSYGRTSSRISIVLGLYAGGGIGEQLSFVVYSNSELKDTIWLGSPSSVDPPKNYARAIYGYEETDASAGQFRFPSGEGPTGRDYLLFDYINEDTTILEGRFQVRFPERIVNSYVNAPDTMRLECGSFRVEQR